MFQLLLISAFVSTITALCSFKDPSFSVNWTVADGELKLEIESADFGPGNWGGIGFGPSLSDLDLFIISVFKDEKSVSGTDTKGLIGQTTKEGLKFFDLKEYSNNYGYGWFGAGENGGVMSGNGNRPLKAVEPWRKDISGCTQWHFFPKTPIGENRTISLESTNPTTLTVCRSDCETEKINESGSK